jgi:hypothetical protein
MHESILRDYFVGLVDESVLKADLEGTVVQTSHDVFTYEIIYIKEEIEVIPEYLVKLCDSFLMGKLEAADLEIIGNCLAMTDSFIWDNDTESGELVAETVYDWATPEHNYPITIENIKKFRERLSTGKDTFTVADTN